jgi:hypothetical protein
MKRLYLLVMIVVLSLTFSACSSVSTTNYPSSNPSNNPSNSSSSNHSNNPSSATPNWGVQTKTTGCVAHNALQDSACTPGAIIASATKAEICRSGYASSVRDVPVSVKNKAYAEYGIRSHSAGEYEVDHLVSLELGGSNDIANLWPEAASPKPGFHEKDKVENYLHNQVCSGAISLQDAQVKIATNWLAVYDQMPSK